MAKIFKTRTQRLVLLVIIIFGVLWGLGVFQGKSGQPSALGPNQVSLSAALKDQGVHAEGRITSAAPAFVFVSVLRRVTVNNAAAYTTFVTGKKTAVTNGAFSVDLGPFDMAAWREQLKNVLKANTLSPDAVLEVAVSPVALKTPVNRGLIATSSFLGYQEK